MTVSNILKINETYHSFPCHYFCCACQSPWHGLCSGRFHVTPCCSPCWTKMLVDDPADGQSEVDVRKMPEAHAHVGESCAACLHPMCARGLQHEDLVPHHEGALAKGSCCLHVKETWTWSVWYQHVCWVVP